MTEAITTTLMIAAGLATRYDATVMEQAYQNQLAMGHITPCDYCVGRVALLDCSRLDERVWLRVDGSWLGPVHVADCAAGHDVDNLKKRAWAVDLSWPLAKLLGVIDDVKRGVEVWAVGPYELAWQQWESLANLKRWLDGLFEPRLVSVGRGVVR